MTETQYGLRLSSPPRWARDLRRHGDGLAVATPEGELTYTRLADRVEARVEELGTRRVVLVAADNDLESLIWYLAGLAGGHVVLLCADRQVDGLVTGYDPDVVIRAGHARTRRPDSAHQPHPDLALLLSTSGTTGSPKLVRLSRDNLEANASGIAEALDIRETDRASASLPMHYCYGLSIINSNLSRGAGVLLTNDSVIDERFWELFSEYSGTSLSGVPHTFDLLARTGFAERSLPTLRYVTQAGGRLAPERIREFARLGARRGWRFHPMYGQTEATARMSVCAPEEALTAPGTLGRPLAGGSFEVDQGELVYRGPNVMLGYAHGPDDLRSGRTIEALRTGDLVSRRDDGRLVITGRVSRIVKMYGLRVDLDSVERMLDHQAACVRDTRDEAEALVIVTEHPDGHPDLAARLGLPPDSVRVLPVAALPRTVSGKIDYAAVTRMAAHPPTAGPGTDRVRDAVAEVLGRPVTDSTATFTELGGDSLNYVRMSLELERILGFLPENWHNTPIDELTAMAAPRDSGSSRLSDLEIDVVLRAVAITLVVGSHLALFHILGGAHLLLIIAGWTFARFSPFRRQPADGDSHRWRTAGVLTGTAARIAVPSVLWLLWRISLDTDVRWSNVLLVNNYQQGGAFGYWFIEVLVHLLLLFAMLFSIPAVRRWERENGVLFAAGLLGVCLIAHLFADDSAFPERSMTTHGVAWFFALGWLAYRLPTRGGRLLTLGLAVLLVPGYFDNPTRETIILVGFALLMFVPRLRVPRLIGTLLGPVAASSLYVYLTHYAVADLPRAGVPGVFVLLGCLLLGVVTSTVVRRATPRPQRLLIASDNGVTGHRPPPVKRPMWSRTHSLALRTRTSRCQLSSMLSFHLSGRFDRPPR